MSDFKENVQEEKKSLMNALENLEKRERSLAVLVDFSNSIVRKLEGPRAEAMESLLGPVDEIDQGKVPIPTLVDLFNIVAEKIHASTQMINSNLEAINSTIE